MFVKINVTKYQGNQGSIVNLPIWLNLYSVSYIDTTDSKRLIIHIIGENGTGLYVTDEDSITILMDSMR